MLVALMHGLGYMRGGRYWPIGAMVYHAEDSSYRKVYMRGSLHHSADEFRHHDAGALCRTPEKYWSWGTSIRVNIFFLVYVVFNPVLLKAIRPSGPLKIRKWGE